MISLTPYTHNTPTIGKRQHHLYANRKLVYFGPMKKAEPKKDFHAWIPTDLWDKFTKSAEAEGRSFNAQIVWVIRTYLRDAEAEKN